MQKLFSLLLAVVLLVCSVSSQITQTQLAAVDLDVLIYAYTLESLEAAFYNKYQATFTSNQFQTAGYSALTYTYFNTIQTHENTHVAFLQSIINGLSPSNISSCTFNFPGVVDVPSYVGLARLLENTGVTAYDGAVNAISNPTYAQAAGTIATVEARHAAYLNTLNGTYTGSPYPPSSTPFPNAQDTPAAPATVGASITAFIVTCPYVPSNVIAGITVVPVSTILAAHLIGNPTSAQTVANDINVLQFALTFMLLQQNFYNGFLLTATVTTFTNGGLTATDYAYFQLIQSHINSYVTALSSTITTLGGKPVGACTYNFAANYGSLTLFVTAASSIAQTSVSALDTALNLITDPTVKQTAATIATVEGRKASYLLMIQNNTPFPNSFEPIATGGVNGVVGMLASIGATSCPAFTIPTLMQLFGSNFTNNATTATTAAAYATTTYAAATTGNYTTGSTSTTGSSTGVTGSTGSTSPSGTTATSSTSTTQTHSSSTTSTTHTSSAARVLAGLTVVAAVCAVLF